MEVWRRHRVVLGPAGHITYDEFEGRIKKMWDPAHYVGWEARVLFNSGPSRHRPCRVPLCPVRAKLRCGDMARHARV